MVHPAGIEPTTFGFGDNRIQIPSTYIQTTYKSQNFQLVLKLKAIFVKYEPTFESEADFYALRTPITRPCVTSACTIKHRILSCIQTLHIRLFRKPKQEYTLVYTYSQISNNS